MLELFVVGTFWFWALLIIELLVLFVFIENENGWGATISLLIFLGLIQWAGDVNVIGFIRESPLKALALVGVYFGAGTIWGIIKWYLFCRDRLDKYRDLKDEFYEKHGIAKGSPMPEELKKSWTGQVSSGYERSLSQAPRVRDNKGNILRWMGFWPISMTWSLCDDFIKKTFKLIIKRLTTFLQAMSDKIYAGVEDDLDDSSKA